MNLERFVGVLPSSSRISSFSCIFFFFQGRTSVDKEGVHTQVFGCGRMAVNQKSEFCLHFLVLLGMKPSFN